jgi:hypothetical protein
MIPDVPGTYSTSDEFSCPCCGTPTDSSYCAACEAFECGERDRDDPSIDTCLVPSGVKVWREEHAAHYAYGHPKRGHDLLWAEVAGPTNVRPAGLSADFEFAIGNRIGGVQTWLYTRKAPLSPGKCGRCE